jgi:hypothetical protein
MKKQKINIYIRYPQGNLIASLWIMTAFICMSLNSFVLSLFSIIQAGLWALVGLYEIRKKI